MDLQHASTEDEPVACTLDGTTFQSRIAGIADLNRDGLRDARRNDLKLALRYHPSVRGAVAELMERERECCRFLDFALTEDIDSVTLQIVVPERARESADTVFAHFLVRSGDDTVNGATQSARAPGT